MVGPWVMRATVALEAWVGGTMAPASATHTNTTTPAAVKALLISTSPFEEGISLILDAELPPFGTENLAPRQAYQPQGLKPGVFSRPCSRTKVRGFHGCSHVPRLKVFEAGTQLLRMGPELHHKQRRPRTKNNAGPAEARRRKCERKSSWRGCSEWNWACITAGSS